MPYKNIEDKRAAGRRYYHRHKDQYQAYKAANPEIQQEAQRRFRSTAEGKAKRAAYQRVWRQRNRDKVRAHMAIRHEIEAGRMERPEKCACGAGPVQAHHHMGYDQEHWLDVEWLCVPCHRNAHA